MQKIPDSLSKQGWQAIAFPFLKWWPRVTPGTLRADLLAGLTGAIVALPQGVAFATIAGMPPEYGLYAGMIPAIVAALFGSSWLLVSGPTTAASIVLFSSLSVHATPGTPEYVQLALTMTMMVGLLQLVMGLARFGALVNFISHSVVVGFTAGAAILIAASQLKHFFGLTLPRTSHFHETAWGVVSHWQEINPSVTAVGPERALALLGMSLSRAEVARRLRAIGATVAVEGRDLVVAPPSWRSDLAIEADLAEEIARLGGYDAVPSTLPRVEASGGGEDAPRLALRRLRRLLAAEGLSEMVTLAFADVETNRALPGFVGAALRPIAVANPLSSELGELRRTPLVGLVRAARLNAAQGATFVGAFELGKGYGLGPAGERREPRAVALLLWGHWPPRGLERSGPPLDFFDLKGALANVLAASGLGADVVRWRPAPEVGFLHPGKAARIELRGHPLGVAGALHPRVAQVCDLAGEVWVAELDFEGVAFYGPGGVGPRPLPRVPAVSRDIAVVVDESFEADAIVEEIRALHDPLIESVRVFDCYRGAPVPQGRKSLAYSIAYRAPDRTLTDDEVNAVHARVRERLRERFQLELRS